VIFDGAAFQSAAIAHSTFCDGGVCLRSIDTIDQSVPPRSENSICYNLACTRSRRQIVPWHAKQSTVVFR
jgi:hypothetical protein